MMQVDWQFNATLIEIDFYVAAGDEAPLARIDLTQLRPRQNGRHFPDDIFKCIFLKENI